MIAFQSSLAGKTIDLSSSLGALNLAETAGPEVIEGPAAGVTVSGGGAVQVFNIAKNVTATISSLTVTGGSTRLTGGGLANNGTLTLTNCTVSGNTCGKSGGGLENFGTLTLTGCTVAGNSALNYGGAISNVGTATLSGCTVSGNSAASAGGGIRNDGTLTVTDSTVAGNSAGSFGGGLYILTALTLVDCTVAGNSAGHGGGLYAVAGASLEDTIVATNTGATGPSDIAGVANQLSGTFNLIGTGGSGGITNGSGNNIVLTSLADPGLAPLGNYGGPTETVPLLPGSAAIGAGTEADDPITTTPITTDQRGKPLDAIAPDIGAFQSHGFALVPIPGSTPQSAPPGASFDSLGVTVKANNPIEPVAGGVITFTVPSSGASAVLSSSTAVIASSGEAEVSANANSAYGSYTVTATAAGAALPVSFNLDNAIIPAFSALSSSSIGYGASRVLISGKLTSGSQSPPGTESVQITLGSVTESATIGTGGAFSATFSTSGLGASGSPFTINFSYPGDTMFTAATDSSTLTVSKATPTVALSLSAGSSVFGQGVTLTATVFSLGLTPAGTAEFFDGPTLIGAAALNGLGRATLTTAALAVGSQSITALYSGDADRVAATSAASAESVAQAGTHVVLVTEPVFKKRKIVATALKAEVQPIAPGAGVPTGWITFEAVVKGKGKKAKAKEKVLGSAAVSVGSARLTVRAKQAKGPLMVMYSGDADFDPSSSVPTAVVQASPNALWASRRKPLFWIGSSRDD